MFKDSQHFLNAFETKYSDFYDPILLKDTKFGFSIKRDYPNNLEYKPNKNKDGKPLVVSLMWVSLKEDTPNKKGHFPLSIRISSYTLQPQAPVSTDGEISEFDDDDNIVVDNGNTKPLELVSNNDYFYDPASNVFVNKKGNIIRGIDILKFMFEEHCDTVHKFKKQEYLLKTRLQGLASYILLAIMFVLYFGLEKLYGYKIISELSVKLNLKDNIWGFKKIEKIDNKKLQFFGWEADKASIVILSFFIVLVSLSNFYFTMFDLEYFRHIYKSNLLVGVHIVAALVLIEILPEKVLFPILQYVSNVRRRLIFIDIKPFTYKIWLPWLLRTAALIFLLWANYYLFHKQLSII